METHGFLKRAPAGRDRRSKLVFLTDKGINCRVPLMNIALGVMETAVKDIEKTEIDNVKITLGKIIHNINENF